MIAWSSLTCTCHRHQSHPWYFTVRATRLWKDAYRQTDWEGAECEGAEDHQRTGGARYSNVLMSIVVATIATTTACLSACSTHTVRSITSFSIDKFVGGSEQKIRDLFADAEKEQVEMGDNSMLHIIIFDEMDAIMKSRGSTNVSSAQL